MKKIYNSAVVNGSIEKTWETIKDFHNMSWGDMVITKLDIVGDISGTEVGAKRILNEAFHETLLSVDNEAFSFTYGIDDGPAPLNKDAALNYVGKVTLYPVTDSGETLVEWISTYDSSDPSTVADFCNPIYAGLLGSLKSKF